MARKKKKTGRRKRAPSAWNKHVMKTYRAGKSKGMSFKQAMTKAKSTYRKKK